MAVSAEVCLIAVPSDILVLTPSLDCPNSQWHESVPYPEIARATFLIVHIENKLKAISVNNNRVAGETCGLLL